MNSLRSDNSAVSYLLALVCVTTALVNPSLQIYLGNLEQFSASLLPALRLGLLLALLCLLLLLVVLRACNTRNRARVGLVLAILSILFWMQGNLLVWDYGVLDGSAINWETHLPNTLVDIACWLGVGVICAALIRYKKSKLIVQAAVILWILQVVAVVFGLVEKPSALRAKTSTYSAESIPRAASFSQRNNVLHIVVDAFQADVFEQLINTGDSAKSYNQSFDGFVYYREAMGIFPRTKYSVPAFLAADVYDNKTKDGYIERTLTGKTILSVAKQNQYTIDIVADGAYQILQYEYLPHNSILDLNDLPALGRELSEAALLLDLNLFRILPGFLKPSIYNEQKWTISRLIRGSSEHLNFEYFTNAVFLNQFVDAMTVSTDTPAYKYIHLFSTHGPKVVTKECRYAGGVYPHNRETYSFMAKCTLDSLAQLLDKMKSLNIYENSLIVIHADHGAWVQNLRQPTENIEIGFQAPSESTVGLLPSTIRAVASPLLAIKLPYAKGEIQTSDKLASLVDIPDTISDAMGWAEQFRQKSLIQLDDGESRTRYFRYYDREKHSELNDFVGPMAEYKIQGSHYESEWVLERLLLPDNAEENSKAQSW